VARFAFVADGQAPVAGQPGDRPFDDPPVAAEFVAGFDAFAGDARGDPAPAEPVAQRGNVVGLVRVQLDRFPAPGSAAGPDRRQCLDQGLERVAVVGVGRRDTDGQRQAGPVGQSVDLRAGFAAVDRARAGQSAPLFALTDAPSRTARDQSIMPLPPSSSNTAWCSCRHNPASVHSVNRRCAVGTVTPKLGER
jgi:hypothetical protein